MKNKLDIAKEAYKQIVEAIMEVEEKYHILCDLPMFIEIDGEKFFRKELHQFCFERKAAQQNIDSEYIRIVGGISDDLLGKMDNKY